MISEYGKLISYQPILAADLSDDGSKCRCAHSLWAEVDAKYWISFSFWFETEEELILLSLPEIVHRSSLFLPA